MTTSNGNGDAPLLVQVTLSRFGNTRKGDLDEIKTDADKAMLALSKRLLDCDEYTALRRHDHDVVTFIRRRSVPSLFKAGVYQIRPEYAEEINARLQLMSEMRQEFVKALVAMYEVRQKEAMLRLGAQYREEDYPESAAFAVQFTMEWRFFTLSAPGKVKGLSRTFIEKERSRLSSMFEEAKKNAVVMLRCEVKGLVEHLIDRLTPDEATGKRKRLSESAVTNIAEFIETFKMRDIANDEELAALLADMNAIVAGVDVDLIRDETLSLDDARKPFEKMKAQIDQLVEAAPRRFVDPSALAE